MDFKKVFWIVLAPLLLCGFRLLPFKNLWDINSSTATSSKLFVEYPNPTLELENDLPSDDPLYGTATVTVQQVMQSIFDDYNNIQGSFLTLVDTNDADFAAYGENRTIKLEDGAALGATSGGYAKPSYNGSNIDGCTIVLIPKVLESAKYFTAAMTHEMGHCFGLDHPMDTVHSVMSYYKGDDILRLQIDDKMGLVYLYPVDTSKVKEDPTLGLSCSRR